MSVFNLKEQNANLDSKIVAGLERLSQVFRILLWEKAKQHRLSPIQIQLLIFIKHHSADKSTISYLAQEFNVTKPTISDAIKVLEQKKMIKKLADEVDTRSYTIQLTAAGKSIVSDTEHFVNPVTEIIVDFNLPEKLVLWQNITKLITQLHQSGAISVQRTCHYCKHLSTKNEAFYCRLLEQKLLPQDVRIDCAEFEVV
ncbi:MAG: winged helix-turn-helix transcriptional regulator [Bacteroidia bacterium]|nr:winged helix-turn-helix transcriptional regulator [Bacteroidia bacterium]